MRRRPVYHQSRSYENIQPTGPYDRPSRQQEPNYPYEPYPGPNPYQTPFQYYAKPTQPEYWPPFMENNTNFTAQTNQDAQNSFLTQFQDGDGQLDIEKMLSTVNQLANTVQQVSPVIKQFSSVIKSFK